MRYLFGLSALLVLVISAFTLPESSPKKPIATAGGDPENGKILYANCATCHNRDGSGMRAVNAPALTGQPEWYTIRQIENFKAGKRGYHESDSYGKQMVPMAMMLADKKAIADVAAYVKTLEVSKAFHKIKDGDVAKGEAIYKGSCAICHGAKGAAQEMQSTPRIQGRDGWYMLRQLENFKSGARGSHKKDPYGFMMQKEAKKLESKQDMLDVIAYIQTLKS